MQTGSASLSCLFISNEHEVIKPNAMSDDNSQNSDTPASKKGFFSLILNQLFHGEPKNRDDLLAYSSVILSKMI